MNLLTRIHALFLLFATAVPVFAAAPAPKLFIEKPHHDIGRVLSGEVIHHTFVLKNTGTAPLILTNVVASCGCTAIQDWVREIPPGGEGRIPLEFNTNGMLGQVSKSVVIHSNDPVVPISAVVVQGLLWQYVEVSPSVAVMFVPPNTTEPITSIVKIVNQTDQPLKLESPVGTDPYLTTTIVETSPGKEFDLVIKTPPNPPAQDVQSIIRIKTSSKEKPEIEITAVAILQQEVFATPSQLFLPAAPPDQNEPYKIRLENFSPASLSIKAAKVTAPGSKIEVTEVKPGREFELAVTFPPDLAFQAGVFYEITVETTNEKVPVLTIPVMFAQPLQP